MSKRFSFLVLLKLQDFPQGAADDLFVVDYEYFGHLCSGILAYWQYPQYGEIPQLLHFSTD